MTTEQQQTDLSRLRINREQSDEATPVKSSGRRIGLIVTIVVVLLGIAAAWKWAGSRPVEIELSTVAYTSPSQADAVLTASGYVVAQQKAAVASKGTGRLVYLGVEEGDHVTKGQIIARLEDQDVQAALNRAKADLEVARADDDDARLSFERTKTLYERRLVAKSDYDAAKARFDRVHASILSAEAAVQEAEVALENTRIRAPFNGTVLTKDADVGEVVAPFGAATNSRGAVVTMADMSSLQVEADVSESNITRVSAGQPCEIVLDAYPNKRYQGTVHKIVPTADRSKATVLTKVAFLNRDSQVLPEMSAKVTFLTPGKTQSTDVAPVLSVVSSAVVQRDGTQVVFMVRDGRAVETPVRCGRTLGMRTEILQGLQAGDQVVARPSDSLGNGSVVEQKKS